MPNTEHLTRLKQGVEAWNQWREENPDIQPDLRRADLRHVHNLSLRNLSRVDLTGAYLSHVELIQVNLAGASLSGADLIMANLIGADLTEADLSAANLWGAGLEEAKLIGAVLIGANLSMANLSRAVFIGANLSGADLTEAHLVETKFEGANLTGCKVYGISAWDVNLVGARQSDLVITRYGEPVITVDNLDVAQFIYLLLHNDKIREVINTITSKAVLILGRFTPERKAVLDAMREDLRHRNYLPILFDFEAPGSRDFTETISTLAHMARFIIADLTEPSSLPKELEAIVPTLAVPVQPVLEGTTRPYSMFQDYWKYHWVLKVHRYEDLEGLITSLGNGVISPAEVKVQELEETRKAIAEELLKRRPG